jgi:hypothetical protein
MFKTVLFLSLLAMLSTTARAQPLSLEDGITEAILDLTTTPRRHLLWRPCGESFRGHDPEARTYANDIAKHIIRAAGSDLDPWVMTAQLAQESGFNPCAFSNQEFHLYARSLGRRPNERDIMRLLTSRTAREEHGIRGVDAGIAQFRWPGIARSLGVSRPEELLNVGKSLTVFATALRRYRDQCEGTPTIVIMQETTRGGRVVVRRHSYECRDVYWAIHNSGSARSIRQVYINNVRRRLAATERWRRLVEREEEPSG